MSGEALIYDAELNPTKDDIAARYAGIVTLLGSYRLVDPEEEVGIEILIGTDLDGRGVQLPLTYRSGDVVAPQIKPAEPLGLELLDFASAIREGATPVSSPRLGLEVVFALEALERSLHAKGEPVKVRSADDVRSRKRRELVAS